MKLATDQRAVEDEREAMLEEIAAQRKREKAEIEDLREAVLRDRAALDDEIQRMATAMPSTDEKLKLNVGGVRFETSRSVLTKIPDSMLGRMFGRCDLMLPTRTINSTRDRNITKALLARAKATPRRS